MAAGAVRVLAVPDPCGDARRRDRDEQEDDEQQLAGTGVRINAICPGLIETGMTQARYDQARAAGKGDRIGKLNPLLRGGEPEEIAALALFLASDAASYITGQSIAADGGLSSSHPTVRRPADTSRSASW